MLAGCCDRLGDAVVHGHVNPHRVRLPLLVALRAPEFLRLRELAGRPLVGATVGRLAQVGPDRGRWRPLQDSNLRPAA
jgi:hypothetical protein